MKYHYLSVSVEWELKHSPSFSVFPSGVHGFSDAELCCVPIPSMGGGGGGGGFVVTKIDKTVIEF